MLQVKVDMENSTNYTRYTTGGRNRQSVSSFTSDTFLKKKPETPKKNHGCVSCGDAIDCYLFS